MKKFLVVLGLSALAMAGKCSSSDADKSKEASEKTSEEFPVKEDSQVPAEEVPSYEQQEEAAPAAGTTPEATPAPTETPAPEAVPAAGTTEPGKTP